MVRHDLVQALLEVRERFIRIRFQILWWRFHAVSRPWHAVLTFVRVRGDAHALLIARVEGVLNESQILLPFRFDLSQSCLLIVDLSL